MIGRACERAAHRLCRQMTSKVQNGGKRICDVWALFLHNGRKWRDVVHLYKQMARPQKHFRLKFGKDSDILSEVRVNLICIKADLKNIKGVLSLSSLYKESHWEWLFQWSSPEMPKRSNP